MSFEEIRPKDDAEWLDIRNMVLTASDMGVILGLNKWKSVAELIEGKKKYVPFENAYTYMGQTLEPVVVAVTNRVLNIEFKLYEDVYRSFFVDFDVGLGATPDAGTEDILLECKTTKPGNYLRWHGWPPAYYISQLYTQMICTGHQVGLLSIMSTNLTQTSDVLNIPLHIHRISRSEELDNIFLTEVKRFWETSAKGKVYRVNRKQAPEIELKLRAGIERIYG